jgi:hypothetical protein
MNNQFTCKVRYTKELENGTLKRVSESFLVHAYTFGGAEEEIYKHLGDRIKGEFIVEAITKVQFMDIFESETHGDYFEVKVKHTVSDEDSGKDKKSVYSYLASAADAKEAYDSVMSEVNGFLFDPEVSVVKESKIMEVFLASVVE